MSVEITLTPAPVVKASVSQSEVAITLTTKPVSVVVSSGFSTAQGDARYLLESNNLSDLVNASTARVNLNVEIGVDVQAWDAQLDDIAGLAYADGNFIVGDGSNWVAESGGTVRTSLGLVAGGAGDIWAEKAGDVLTGDFIFSDTIKALFGTGSDASILYDNTNLIIDPNEVGTGAVIIEPTTDATTIFRVNKADGTVVVSADTTNVRWGIGTASPARALEIYATVAYNAAILLHDAGGGYPFVYLRDTSANRVQFYKTLFKSGMGILAEPGGVIITFINENPQISIPVIDDFVGLSIKAFSTQTNALVQHQTSNADVHNEFFVAHASNLYTSVFNKQGSPLLDFKVLSDSADAIFVDASENVLHIAVATKIGDGGTTDYANIANDGEITLFGAARVLRSVDFEPDALKKAGVGPDDSTEDGFPIHDYDPATDESVFLHWEIPHNYASAGEIHMHVEFFVDTAPTSAKNVTWGIEYKKQSIGDNFDFSSSTTTIIVNTALTTGTPANDKKMFNSSQLLLTTTGFEPMDIILIRLFRDANASEGDATDDFGSDARVFNYHLMYLSDKLGEAT